MGEVVFTLRKIKGKATDYDNPFRIIRGEVLNMELQVHDGKIWDYAKILDLLGRVLDAPKLIKWAGESMFSIEADYYI